MYNDLFSIGPFTVHTYGLMIGIGIIAAYFLAEHRAKQMKFTEKQINDVMGLVIFCVIFGFAGSKLLYIITVLPKILDGTMTLAGSVTGGWVVFGGLLGGIAGGLIFCKWRKEDFWAYADLAMPAVSLAQAFGRVGCFFAGCCYGVETESSWFYTEFSTSAFAPNHVHLLPTQLIMAVGDFLLFTFLLLYEKKWQKAKGEIIGLYLILYSLGRFIVEFWRGDLIRGQIGVLSTSQFIGLFTVAAGILIFVFSRRNAEKSVVEVDGAAEKSNETENADSDNTKINPETDTTDTGISDRE